MSGIQRKNGHLEKNQDDSRFPAIPGRINEEEAVTLKSQLKVQIRRDAVLIIYPFTEFFKGFEQVEAVQRLFGEKTEGVLNNLKIEFRSGRGYMGVSDEDGHLFININYLKRGRLVDLYLDIIHELVHVKQFLEGKKLRDTNLTYVDRPTEIEAYRHAVDEARRIGLDEKQIFEYLKIDRMSREDLNRLAKAVNVRGAVDATLLKNEKTQLD